MYEFGSAMPGFLYGVLVRRVVGQTEEEAGRTAAEDGQICVWLGA